MPRGRPALNDAQLKNHIENSKVIDASGCWLWTHALSSKGYGRVRWNKQSTSMTDVHRVYWLLCGKTIPEGNILCHGPLCVGKKHCFNPDHLTPGTPTKNQLDRHRDGTMMCKLTPEQILEIRASTNTTCRELGKKYNVSFGQIARIIKKKSWVHI